MEPGIAIVIPTLNNCEQLDKAIACLAAQTVAPAEILIINDGSTDGTAELLVSWKSRLANFDFINNEKNIGVVESMEIALSTIKSNYFISVATDDHLRPNCVKDLLEMVVRWPNAGIYCCDYEGVYADGRTQLGSTKMSTIPHYFSPAELKTFLKTQNDLSFPTSSSLWRLDALQNVGGFLTCLRWHCDWFAAYALALRFGVCYRPEVIQTVIHNIDSFSSRGQRDVTSQTQVIRALLTLLDLPSYADIRESFQIPAILSRFGSLGLKIMMADERYWHYLSDNLISSSLKFEGHALPQQTLNYFSGKIKAMSCEAMLRSLSLI